MAKSRERNFRLIPRRNLSSRNLGTWRIHVQCGESEEDVYVRDIYFKALHGGETKSKALPKLQSFLSRCFWDYAGSPQVKATLEPISGCGGNGVPSYVLRGKYSFCRSLVAARKPSQVFKIKNGR